MHQYYVLEFYHIKMTRECFQGSKGMKNSNLKKIKYFNVSSLQQVKLHQHSARKQHPGQG